jgi:hypothetical protein
VSESYSLQDASHSPMASVFLLRAGCRAFWGRRALICAPIPANHGEGPVRLFSLYMTLQVSPCICRVLHVQEKISIKDYILAFKLGSIIIHGHQTKLGTYIRGMMGDLARVERRIIECLALRRLNLH